MSWEFSDYGLFGEVDLSSRLAPALHLEGAIDWTMTFDASLSRKNDD